MKRVALRHATWDLTNALHANSLVSTSGDRTVA